MTAINNGPQLSCADYTWPMLAHNDVLAIINSLEVPAVDIALFGSGSHVNLSAVVEDPAYWAGRVQERLARHALLVADVFLTPGADLQSLAPTNPSAPEIERSRHIFRQTLEFAARVGSPGITMLPGVVHPGDTYGRALDHAIEELSFRSEVARERGIRLSVEPHVESLISLPEQTLALVQAVPRLELTLDIAHFAYQGFGLADIEPLIAYTRHVQLRAARHGHMQVRVKDDASNIPAFVQMLNDAAYSTFIALEYVWMEKWACDRVDNTAETVAMLNLVRPILETRRTQ